MALMKEALRDYIRTCDERVIDALADRIVFNHNCLLYECTPETPSDFEKAIKFSEQTIVHEGGYIPVFRADSQIDTTFLLGLYTEILKIICRNDLQEGTKYTVLNKDVAAFAKLNARINAGRSIGKCKYYETPGIKALVEDYKKENDTTIYNLITDIEQEKAVKERYSRLILCDTAKVSNLVEKIIHYTKLMQIEAIKQVHGKFPTWCRNA